MNDRKRYEVFLSEYDMRKLHDLVAWIGGFEANGKRVEGGLALKHLVNNGLVEVKKNE